jgi:hypothetical protein
VAGFGALSSVLRCFPLKRYNLKDPWLVELGLKAKAKS